MRADEKLFSVSEFARFSRVTRAMLLHYDKIGLLAPAVREGNGYRLYSIRQLAAVNMIRTALELGLTLGEIKQLRDKRTPERFGALLRQLMRRMDEATNRLSRSRKLLWTLQDCILSASNVDEGAITVQPLPAEAIVLGEPNDYSGGKNDFDALSVFYRAAQAKYPDLDLNYPVWGLLSAERVRRGDWNWPDRYYFYNPEGHDKRPAGLYAIGYARGGYGKNEKLYERLAGYIDRNGFEVCGDAYEEYPLNELCVADDTDYLKRIMIAVREKPAAPRRAVPGEV